jgi:hypothetical protein
VYGSNKLRQGNSVKSLRAKEENVFKMWTFGTSTK